MRFNRGIAKSALLSNSRFCADPDPILFHHFFKRKLSRRTPEGDFLMNFWNFSKYPIKSSVSELLPKIGVKKDNFSSDFRNFPLRGWNTSVSKLLWKCCYKNGVKSSVFQKCRPKNLNFFGKKKLNFINFYFHSKAYFGDFGVIKPQNFRCAAKKGGISSVLKILKSRNNPQKVQFLNFVH